MLIPDEYEETRQRSEESARRFAAAVSGAIEGFLSAFEEHRVADEAKASIQTAGEVARAAGGEARAQGATPEMQDLGRGLRRVGEATSDAAHSAADATRDAAASVAGSARAAKDSVAAKASDTADAIRGTVDAAYARYENVKEEVKVRADAVGETTRRARVAPGRIAVELKAAYGAWMRGLVTAIVMGVVMAVFGILTLTVLTIALVVGLNELVGDPAGTWIVAGIYTVTIIAAYFVMRSRREAAARETARRIENSRAEVQHVTAPVKAAFSGRGRAGF